MNLNCYTDSLSLQTSMESMVENNTGKLFGPPGSKKLIYFIDDLNMPGHLSVFNPDVSANGSRIVKAAVDLHRLVTDVFVPTAIKFHYIFNLRELSSVFEGLCRSREMFYSTNLSVVRLFIHEAERVYQDRMITEQTGRAIGTLCLTL